MEVTPTELEPVSVSTSAAYHKGKTFALQKLLNDSGHTIASLKAENARLTAKLGAKDRTIERLNEALSVSRDSSNEVPQSLNPSLHCSCCQGKGKGESLVKLESVADLKAEDLKCLVAHQDGCSGGVVGGGFYNMGSGGQLLGSEMVERQEAVEDVKATIGLGQPQFEVYEDGAFALHEDLKRMKCVSSAASEALKRKQEGLDEAFHMLCPIKQTFVAHSALESEAKTQGGGMPLGEVSKPPHFVETKFFSD